MKSFCDYLALSREVVSVAGREGIPWTELLHQLQLPLPQLQSLLFRSLRQQFFYQFLLTPGGQEIDSFQFITEANQNEINRIRVHAPLAEIYRILGISSELEIPPDPGMLILEKIAKSKEKGLLMSEIGKLTDKKTAIYPTIDKLVTMGFIRKRLVSPMHHVSNSRGKGRVVIVHLVRYAHLYDPHKDHMEFEFSESDCEELQQSISNILTEKGVNSIPVFHIAPRFQVTAKQLTRKISTSITQLKSKSRLTLTTDKYRGKGPFTHVTCPSLGQELEEDDDAGCNDDEDDNSSLLPSNTIFNMTVYDQVIYRLNMSNGLTSRKIKQLTGLRKKRCSLIVSTLMKTLKYRHETVQSGRQKLYLIFGRDPFQYSSAPPPPPPKITLESGSPLEMTGLSQERSEIGKEYSESQVIVEAPTSQIDLYSIRRNTANSCLEQTGGIIDNYTLLKEIELCYKELDLSSQVDRKTVKRLMMKYVEEGKHEYVASVEHPEVKTFWMKPHLIFQKDLPNTQDLVMGYIRKLRVWFVTGKKGRFLDSFHSLPGETISAEEEPSPSDPSGCLDEEEERRMEMCRNLESQIRTEFHLGNLMSYREDNLIVEAERNQKTSVTLDRMNSMVSLCPHYISSSLVNPLDEVTLMEDNNRFYDNIRLIYFQILRMGQELATDREQSFNFCFLETLLKMKVKPFISIFGLCEEYLTDINQRIRKINKRKSYSSTSYDRIFIESIQLSHPMSALVFSECSVASALARFMLSKAVDLHKLYVLSLLSLGLIQRSPLHKEDETTETIEEFDSHILPIMRLQIMIKSPRSSKVLKNLTLVNRYWDETVAPLISESLRLKNARNNFSIPVTVKNYYNLNMHLGRHSLEDFPSVLLPEQVTNPTLKTPKKRSMKRKVVSESIAPATGDLLEKETLEIEEFFDEVDMEGTEFEEVSRPSKRLRKEELIEVSADQEATALCSALITFLGCPAIVLPPLLTNSSFAGDISNLDVELPWYHPYFSILGARSSEVDVSQQILSLTFSTSGGRRLTRKLPVILSQHHTLRKIISRVLKSLPISCFDTSMNNFDVLETDAETPVVAQPSIRPMVSTIINQLLDDTNRIHQTELRYRAIDDAAMNRALQIYFSHSQVNPREESSMTVEGGQTEENISQEETQFLEDIGSLKEYSLSTIIRIHRELCGKKIITKHPAGGKRKSTGLNRVKGYDIREKVFQNLSAGISGSYQYLLGDFPDEIPLLSDPKHLSEDSHVETSKGDFLCLLHRVAANNGMEDSGRLTVHSAASEAEGTVDIVRMIGEVDDSGGLQRGQGWKVKTSSCSLSGLFSLKLNRVHFEISTPSSRDPQVAPSSARTQSQSSSYQPSARSPEISDLASRTLEYLETEINGHTLGHLTSHFTKSLPELKEALAMLCSSEQVYRYPHYDSCYKEVVLFVHHKYSHFYFGNLPQTLPHLFGWGPSGEAELEMIPLVQQELLCPWMNVDGTKNQTMLSLFLSKLIAVLTMKPQSRISAIHSEFPMLSCTHVAILLKKFVDEGILLRHTFQFSWRLDSPFQSRGAPTESPCSLVDCSFSLSPRLWEKRS